MNRLPMVIDSSLTTTSIKESLGLDLSQDPEMTIYHPAVVLNNIYNLSGKTYGKHTDDTEKIISQLLREDFEQLYTSGKCQSFQQFVNAILD